MADEIVEARMTAQNATPSFTGILRFWYRISPNPEQPCE
jgi:hypothetical protein